MTQRGAEWYPRCSDASELERVAVAHARALDLNLAHHGAHSTRLGALERSDQAQGEKLDALGTAVAEVRATQKAHVRIVLIGVPLAVTLIQGVMQWLAR